MLEQRGKNMKQARAIRPAFFCIENSLYKQNFEFDYFGGFAESQKQKCISSFHDEIQKRNSSAKILEVSRKSPNILGNLLSAFNLNITIKDYVFTVESLYQASKVFGSLQFIECLNMEPGDAKRYVKHKVSSFNLSITEFNLFGRKFPILPTSIFYDYLYVLSLYQNKSIANEIIKYNCFTDIEFNPKKQFSSQARSCSLYKYLYLNNMVEEFLKDYTKFIFLYDKI